MKPSLLFSAVISAFVACAAVAQTPADQLIGTWVGTTATCGPSSTLKFSKVEANGIVHGTFNCPGMQLLLILGEKQEFNKSMATTLKGQNLEVVGANKSGFQLVLEGRNLTGFGLRAPTGEKTPVSFAKQ